MPGPGSSSLPFDARLLGYAATVPLLGTAVAAWLAGSAEDVAAAIDAMRSYGAVCMAFLGGVRLGPLFAMPASPARLHRIGLTILPPALGWLALLPGPVTGLGLLVCGFLVQCLWDVLSSRHGPLPAWYGSLRVRVTAIAALSLIAALGRLILAAG